MNSLLTAGLLKTLSKDLCHLLDEEIEYNVLITTAIRNTHGPSFGDGDLWIKVTSVGKNVTLPSFCRPRSYDKRIFDLEQFQVEDYEVFQIVRKTTVIYL
ncbi:7939_t:CDS:2 [Gigaspora margarita]|uniref:7939_t:CDS:1 n=1 Tax=Gigaspora margarita TaxID=4874 RepID=A0ABN7VJE0_GIGMA|nr:7939_t:CDS:2 [Gigaspora margarita]